MPDQTPIDVVQTVEVQKPMTGAEMLARLNELKTQKDTKPPAETQK